MTRGFWSPHILFAELFDQLISFVFTDTFPYASEKNATTLIWNCVHAERGTHCLYCSNVNKLCGRAEFFKIADCGPTELFKIADLFITEDLYRPATAHEEEKRSKENNSWWYLAEA